MVPGCLLALCALSEESVCSSVWPGTRALSHAACMRGARSSSGCAVRALREASLTETLGFLSAHLACHIAYIMGVNRLVVWEASREPSGEAAFCNRTDS